MTSDKTNNQCKIKLKKKLNSVVAFIQIKCNGLAALLV